MVAHSGASLSPCETCTDAQIVRHRAQRVVPNWSPVSRSTTGRCRRHMHLPGQDTAVATHDECGASLHCRLDFSPKLHAAAERLMGSGVPSACFSHSAKISWARLHS